MTKVMNLMTDFDVKMNRIESEDCRLKIMNEK